MRSFLSLFSFLLALSACRKSDDSIDDPISGPLDIYAVGVKDRMATYWKNGSAVMLNTSAGTSEGYGIAVSGADVYVAGIQVIQGTGNRAVLWKNGTPSILGSGTRSAGARGITIQGADVYVAGYELSAANSYEFVATYWKNGNTVRLGADAENTTSSGIAVVGSDVYVTGWRSTSTRGTINCYWKNGVLFNLGDSTVSTGNEAPALFNSGTDVYAVWTERDAQLYTNTFYSKNFGTPIQVTDGNASAIAVLGSDVYLAGSGPATDPQILAAKYWKNGTPVPLSDGPRHSAALGIALDGADVYTCGWLQANGATNTAVYWKNGAPVQLGDSTSFGFVRQLLLKRG